MMTAGFSLFDSFSEPVLLLEGGVVSACNPAAAQLFDGLAPRDPCPAPLLDIVFGEGVSRAALTVAGLPYALTSREEGAGLLLVLHPLSPPAPPPAHLTAHIRQQAAGLMAATQLLEHAVRSRHGSDYDKAFSRVSHSAYRLLRVLREAELAQALEEELPPPASTLDLGGLCTRLARETESLAQAAGKSFSAECKPDPTPLLVAGDEELLTQMLLALFSNAIKYADAQAGVKVSPAGSRIHVSVWDDGPGMDEARFSALFTPRAPDALPLPKEGLGLGLDNARRIAELHGGALVLTSDPAAGLRVSLSLPRRSGTSLPIRSPSSPGAPDGGFSPLLVALSDALPATAFLPDDLT